MRYICENGDKFLHNGKQIWKAIKDTDYVGEGDTVEIPCCPICYSPVYDEYVLDKENITSVISVELSKVDDMLKQGYTVESLYAKTATLVKKE